MVAFPECVPKAKSLVSNTLSTQSESLHSNPERGTKRGGASLFLGARSFQLDPETAEKCAREVRSGQKCHGARKARHRGTLTALPFQKTLEAPPLSLALKLNVRPSAVYRDESRDPRPSPLPVWVLLWILRFSERAKIFPQPGKGHGKGFSPVCTRMWLTSLYFALKDFPSRGHSSQ